MTEIPNHSSSDLFTAMIYTNESVASTKPIGEVRDFFSVRTIEYAAVAGPNGICGLISRDIVNRTVSGKFGWSLFADKPISEIMIQQILVVDSSSDPLDALRRALARPVEILYTDIAISAKGRFCGLVSIRKLMSYQLKQYDVALERANRDHERLKKIMAANLLDQKVSPDVWERKVAAVTATAAEIDAIEESGATSNGMPGKVNLQGTLGDFSLIDLMQLMVQGRKTGRLDLVCGEGEFALQFSIHLEKGAIVHAEGAGDTGHSALWKAFGSDKGEFSFIFGLKTSMKTITENPLYLLMEACRRIDESTGVDIDQLITDQA